jgi:chromosome segregation ATPase
MKSREIEAAHKCRALEESRDQLSLDYDRLYSDYWSQRDVINDLQARLANNNADLISELQEMITSLEEAAEEASWTDWRQSEEIRRLEGIVDSENISRMEESIDLERSRICKLREENCRLSSEVGRLQYQLNNMRASPPVGETATGVDNYLSDDNLSLFSSSDDNGSN